jgi:hypothetical protein
VDFDRALGGGRGGLAAADDLHHLSSEYGATLGGLGDVPGVAGSQVGRDGRGDALRHSIPVQDGEGVGVGGRIGHRRTRRDDVERRADDVGHDESPNPRGGPECFGQATPFERR